jgi:predicted RNase H-like HicB family nuclease
MRPVRDTVEIKVELFRDQDESYFVAASDELGLVTDGETFEELLHNLRDALELCLEDSADLNITSNPRVVIRMELPEDYAQTA